VGRVPSEVVDEKGFFHQDTDGDVYFHWESVGFFRVRRGQEIVYDPAPEASEDAVRNWVLGPCLATLLHQRGGLVLHASAVSLEGKLTAFLAPSGGGKSTLAAHLCERGGQFFTDDLIPLDPSQGGLPLIHPGFPRMKLWPDALAALGLDAKGFRPVEPGAVKRAWPVDGVTGSQPSVLSSLFVLEEGDHLDVVPLSPAQAFVEVVRHTYLARWLGSAGVPHSSFPRYMALIEGVHVFRLTRPKSLDLLDQTAAAVEGLLGIGPDRVSCDLPLTDSLNSDIG
jgi:hypothetical protein